MSSGPVVYGVAARPRPAAPRWAFGLFAAVAAVNLLWTSASEGWRTLLSFLGAAAAIAVGIWLEQRVYLHLAPRSFALRLPLTLLTVPVAFLLGIAGTVLVDTFANDVSAGAFAGGFWMAGAAFGTTVVLVVDRLGSFARRFATRMQLTVLGVVGVWAAASVAITLFIPRALAKAFLEKPDSVRVDIGGEPKTLPELEQMLAASDWPAALKSLGAAELVSLFSVAVLLLLLLPAVISAAAKLGELAMERIHPLDRAMAAVEAGDLEVRVEEGGNLELRRLAERFNRMVEALGLARRMERAFGAYVSRPVLEQIRAQHGSYELPTVQREATVLFADIRGYTAMSERLSPQQVLDVLRRHYAAMLEEIAAHDGYVDKFIGDAIYVVFNGPIDQPDHLARGARCALALLERVQALNAAGAFPEVERLEIGVGVATGPVIAGNLGNAAATQFSVIGDTVNLAARLSAQAPPGEAWASAATAATLPAELATAPLEPLQLKGKAAPVQPYRLARGGQVSS